MRGEDAFSPAPIRANVIPVHDMKAFKGSGGIAPLILISNPDGADWSTVTSSINLGAHCQLLPHLAQRIGMGGAVTALRSTTLLRVLVHLYQMRTEVSSCGP